MFGHAGEPLLHRLASGVGDRRDHQSILRVATVEQADQRHSRHYLAKRHGVDPDDGFVRSV